MQPFGEAAWETNMENLEASDGGPAGDDKSHRDEQTNGDAFPPAFSGSGGHCAPDDLPPLIA